MADNASITILRNTQANINAEPIKDGNILFTTDQAENKIYADVGTTRIKIGGTVDVDTTLSTTSTNPVQNKVITNSVNDVQRQIHTNLLNPTAKTQTINGVTFTNNGDGTYTVNGTANTGARLLLYTINDTDFSVFQNKKFVGCPTGGSSGTYFLTFACYNGDTWLKEFNDFGNGIVISNIPSNATKVSVMILVGKGQTVNNLLFKPMLTTDLNATYDDYVPYTGDSGRLNEDVANFNATLGAYIAGQRNPDLLGKGAYIGRKIEGGGTIFFDYAIGFKGDISVAPITENLHSYHVDPLTGVVMCDDPEDTTKQDRFMVVSDYDIGDYKHGNNLTWSNGKSGKLYTAIGTETGFGTGKANTEKCIAAATTDGLIEWNANAYNCIWHYVAKGDWNRTTDRGTHVWFVPSKDELNVLLNMQWSTASKRKSYDGSTQLIQLPINFYSYYWSSSESSPTMTFYANFFDGYMGTHYKHNTDSGRVRLVRTF